MKLGFYEYQKQKNEQYKKYVCYLRIKRNYSTRECDPFLNELACSNYNNVQITIKD